MIAGIYKIESISKPQRIYIGSAINIKHRWACHLSDLKMNKHHSPKLQRHFNKYNEDDLQFSILLGCAKEDLIKNEQFFIDFYKPYFNICLIAGSKLGVKMSEDVRAKMRIAKCMMTKETKEKLRIINIGKHHSEETKLKMRIAHLGKYPSVESKERMSIAQKGRISGMKGKHHSVETKAKMSTLQRGNKSFMYGKPGTRLGMHQSEEAKEKFRNTWKLKRKTNKQLV